MATDGNRATTARALKVPRLPGDIMICPMIAGLLINTFCPPGPGDRRLLHAATRGGANAVVAVILLFVGAGISFKATPDAVKTGVVVLIPKLLLAEAMGFAVAWFFNDDLLGLSSVSIIGGISFCNISARGQRPVGWRTPRLPSRCTRRATWF